MRWAARMILTTKRMKFSYEKKDINKDIKASKFLTPLCLVLYMMRRPKQICDGGEAGTTNPVLNLDGDTTKQHPWSGYVDSWIDLTTSYFLPLYSSYMPTTSYSY